MIIYLQSSRPIDNSVRLMISIQLQQKPNKVVNLFVNIILVFNAYNI